MRSCAALIWAYLYRPVEEFNGLEDCMGVAWLANGICSIMLEDSLLNVHALLEALKLLCANFYLVFLVDRRT